MSRQRHGRSALRLLSTAVLVVAVFWLAQLVQATGHHPLENARRLAVEAGSYSVTADIEQNFTPRPHPEMIGRQGERVVWHLEGDVGSQNRAVIELALAGQYATAPPVQVIQNGDDFFLNANGRIDKLEGENPLSTVAPSVEFLEYLEGARDVEEAGTVELGGERFSKYTFQFDGAQYGAYLAAKQQRNSDEPLPPGAAYTAPEAVRRMNGDGELWLDEAGLPRRQLLVIEMPAANPYYDGHMTLTADYRNFGEAPLPPEVLGDGAGGWHIPELFTDRPDTSIFEGIDVVAPGTGAPVDGGSIASEAVVLVLLLAAFLLLTHIYARRPARAYRWIILPIVGSMLLTPLLSATPYRLFAARQAEAAERAAENLEDSPLLQALGIGSTAGGQAANATAAETTASLEPPAQRFSPVVAIAGQQRSAATTGCGAGGSTVDADGDGLTEFVENCIGTYDALADSDLDLITDTVEIEGFTFAGLQWTTDPLKADSNDDGLSDTVEWIAPVGSAPSWDMDGDGQPNPWDDDNDGDGVPDDIDLSPYQVSEVRESAAMSISGDPGDDYVYVEIQLQPENPDHMRYALSPLDWPADSRGTLQDLDDSPADLHLVPYLEAFSTAAPSDALANRYGVLVSGDDASGYLISIPLLPLGVEAVHAFFGKIAFAPGDFVTIDWEWSRMTWHVVMQNDFCGEEQCASPRVAPVHYYYEPFRITGMQVSRSGATELGIFSTPQTPTEDRALFQLMEGLSATYLAAEAVENQAAGRSALAEIASRFRNPVAPFNGTWGIETPMAVLDSPLRYAHRDALTANFGNELGSYLDTHFPEAQYEQFCAGADGVQFRCASVVLAQQARHGVTAGIDLRSEARTFLLPAGDGQDTTVQSLVAAVDLASIDVALVREAQLQIFENLDGRWRPVTDSRMMEIVEDRYAGRWDELAQQTQQIYPSVAPILVRFGAYAGYLIYRAGFQSVIALNGTPLVVAVSADSALTQARIIVGSDLPDAASVALENAGLTEQVEVGGAAVDVALLLGSTLLSGWSDISLLISKILLLIEEPADTVAGQRWDTGNAVAAGIALILSLTFATIAFGFSVAQLACAAKDARGDGQCDEQALQAIEKTGHAINGASSAASVVFAALAVVFAVNTAVGAGVTATAAVVGIIFSAVAIAIAVIMLVATLVLIWVVFALLVTSTSSQMAVDTAVGQAVAGSIVAVLAFLITLIVSVIIIVVLALAIAGVLTATTAGWFLVAVAVIGLILAVIIVIDVIFGLIMLGVTGEYQNVSTAFFNFLADFFSQTTLLTSLEDSAFRGTGTTYAPTDSFMRATGAAAGNEFLIDDYFAAYLTTEGNDGYDFFDNNLPRVVNGDGGDLRRSGAAAWYEGQSVNRLAGDPVTVESVAIASADNSFPGAGFDVSQNARCGEPYGDRRRCDSDLGLRYTFVEAMRDAPLIVDTKIAVELRYELCVFNLIGACVYKDRKSENVRLPKGDQKEDYRLRLYVDILPETLDEFWNWDEIDNPDPDADGLASAEELALGLDPAAWDSDGDGLSDGFEVDHAALLGVDPLQADGDGDGVGDLEEVRKGTDPRAGDSDDDGLTDAEEIGYGTGWLVAVPGAGDVRLFSDPLRADADGDYLPDVQERDFGLSPFAANDAPALAVGVEPLRSAPNGRRAVVARPGDTVTTTVVLASVGSSAVDQTLTLCLPTFLTNGRVAGEGGDRVPPRQVASACNGFDWRFDQSVLQRGELFRATILAEIDGSINSSQRADVSYNLPYQDTPLAGSTTVVVDVDDPTVAFRLPVEGQFLRGASYVAGGAAGDATSWVERVEVDFGEGYAEASGQSPWARTWTLPADGEYTLQARSFDAVGRQSAVASRTVVVDNTPPTLDTTFEEGALITSAGVTVTLSGNAGDNLSGVSRVQLRIDGAPWQEVSLSGNGTDETWRFAWTVGTGAQGSHEFLLRAFDRAGNVSALLQRKAVVDVLPPSSDLTGRISPDEVPVFSPEDTLRGYANERGHLPLAPRPVELDGNVNALQNATVWLSPDRVQDDDEGVNLLWLGDVNGDGLGDLAVGLPAANEGDGRINLFFGRTGDFALPDEAELLSDGDSSFAGSDGAGLGSTVAAPGDVNGDGLADILIGDPANNRVILVLGRVFQYGKESVLGDTIRGTRYTFTAPDGFGLGNWISGAGDVNGDGRRDLLLGGSEQAVLILGDDIAWFGNIDVTIAAALTFDVASTDRIEGVGDLNGDQLDDWVWRNSSGLVVQSAASSGDALAPEALTPVDPAWNHTVLAAAPTGEIEPLGDVDGDGLDDFLFGDDGVPRLVYGREDGAYAAGVSFDSLAPAGWLAAPGDVNADGLNDILIGGSGNRAYLIHGATDLPATPPVEATIAGVAGAASTPFAAGADLNCDFSSDLLLLPEGAGVEQLEAAQIDFTNGGTYQLNRLPLAEQEKESDRRQLAAAVALALHYVDDDGFCDGNSPCHTTLQDASNAADGGDTIQVYPGVYQPVSIGKNGLTVRGVNADAVFVDAAGSGAAVTVDNATGVSLERMTFRNGEMGIQLINAGDGGEDNADFKTRVQNVLVHDVQHAVQMDRTSTLAVDDSTFVVNGPGEAILVTGEADPQYLPTFTRMSDIPWGGISDSGDLFINGVRTTLVAPSGADSPTVYNYDIGADNWTRTSGAPANIGDSPQLYVYNGNTLGVLRGADFGSGATRLGNASLARINAIDRQPQNDGPDHIYIGGLFDRIDGTPARNVAYWDGARWHALGGAVLGTEVHAIAVSGSYVYVGGRFGIARWDTNNSRWDNAGGALALPGTVYALEADGGSGVYAGGAFDEPSGAPTGGIDGIPFAVPANCRPNDYQVALFHKQDFDADDPAGEWCTVLGIGNWGNTNSDAYDFPPNEAHSIIVGRKVRAILYDKVGFGEGNVTLSSTMENLNRIRFDREGGRVGGDLGSMRVVVDNYEGTLPVATCQPNDYQVALYNDENYTGECWLLDAGEHHNSDGNAPWHAKANSMVVGDLVYVEAYKNVNFGEPKRLVADNRFRLDNLRFDGGSNSLRNDIRSLKVVVKESRHRVAHWTGGGWQSLDGGVGGNRQAVVFALERRFGTLYVGGAFEQAATRPQGNTNFASWNGANDQWNPASATEVAAVNGPVRAIAASEGNLLIGGNFSSVVLQSSGAILPAGNVALRTGSGWNAIPLFGLDGTVHSLAIDGSGRFFAGGDFAGRLVRWNGTVWGQHEGGTDGTVYALHADDRDLYAGGRFTQAGGEGNANLGRWTQSYLLSYGLPWQRWERLSYHPLFQQFGNAVEGVTGNGNMYVLFVENGQYRFYRRNITLDSWSELSPPAPTVAARLDDNSQLAWGGASLYLMLGSNDSARQRFLRYDIAGNRWHDLARPPFNAITPGMAWDDGAYLYVTAAGSASTLLARYHTGDDQWQMLDADTALPRVQAGSNLVRAQDAFYLSIGGGSNALWRIDAPDAIPLKLALKDTVIAAPPTTNNASWLGLEQTDPVMLDFRYTTDNVELVGSRGTAWMPAPEPGVTTYRYGQAQFTDRARDVYRIGAGSALDGGYYDYAPPATVSAAGCSGCYSTIQGAVDSGAQAVLVEPGVYQQPFYMVSGLSIYGAGAELTVVAPPPSGSGARPLVSAEGIRSAMLARVTLNGDQTADGLVVEDGARHVRITRNIIRDTVDAIVLRGSTTDTEIVNNTLVDNESGVVAVASAAVDVRNTLFVNHDNAGLSYMSGAPTALHRYNGYSGNAVDLRIDGQAAGEPGIGELFADPFFVNPHNDDFRLSVNSPMIDAGDPSDPSPPGANGRADIGYAEQGAAGFYVDDDYCLTCLNDGLAFGVNAFATIGEAVAAASERTQALGAPDGGAHTVGVAAGTYEEKLRLPSYINLICNGAEQTTIDGTGISGQPHTIRILDASNVTIQHCTITGSRRNGGQDAGIHVGDNSRNVLLQYNLVRDNENGIVVAGGSAVRVVFNTIADNGQHGMHSVTTANSGRSTIEAFNNIVAGNAGSGLARNDDATLTSDYNLLWNNGTDYENTAAGPDDLLADPRLDAAGANPYALLPGSPAADSANPAIRQTAAGGGTRADRGAFELRAVPLALLFGKQGVSCDEANSGVAAVEFGLAPFAEPATPLTGTLPATWYAAALETPGETASYWNGTLPAPADGLYRLYSRATDAGGNQESDAREWFDGVIEISSAPTTAGRVDAAFDVHTQEVDRRLAAAGPTLTIATPQAGALLTGSVSLSGQVGGDAGIAGVFASVDGGATWQPATVDGADWHYLWNPSGPNPFLNYKARVRAVDTNGQTTTRTREFTVDNVAPFGVGPITFNIEPDTHLDGFAELTASWREPIDAGGQTTTAVVLAQDPVARPSTPVEGLSFSGQLDRPGDWYFNLQVTDRAGNTAAYNLGPWHVGTFSEESAACAVRQQSIALDGAIDFLNGEWEADELLDTLPGRSAHQGLYTTWDSDWLYLGVENVWWPADGDLWVYLATGGAGSTTSVDGAHSLPFAADIAVSITEEGTMGTLWRHAADWQPDLLTFAYGRGGDTEIQIPWQLDTTGALQMMAYVEQQAEVSAVFPDANTGQSPWTSSFEWNDLCAVEAPNAGQPDEIAVAIDLTPVEPASAWRGVADNADFVVSLFNRESATETGLTVELSPTTGIALEAVEGATCADCEPGGAWQVTVDTLAPGAGRQFTVRAATTDAPADLRVTGTVLNAYLPGDVLELVPDRTAPTVAFEKGTGAVAPVDSVVRGTAADAHSGVVRVEVRKAGGAWQTANGTRVWQATLTPDGPELLVEARSIDAAGNSSEVESAVFAVDDVPPQITPLLPEVLTQTNRTIRGTAQDSASGIDSVAVQMEPMPALWQPARVQPRFEPGATAAWFFVPHTVPQDNVERQVRFRAVDGAGNVAVSGWQTVMVDNQAPALTVTQLITEARRDLFYEPSFYDPPPAGVLAGTVSDGAGVASLRIRIYTPDGQVRFEEVTPTDGAWSWQPVFTMDSPLGRYNLFVEATDNNGNRRGSGPYALDVLRPISIGSLTLSNPAVTEGDGSWRSISVIATFTGIIGDGFFVDYDTVAGSATPGSDYRGDSGTLVFDRQTFTHTLTFDIKGDRVVEVDETFSVTLGAPSEPLVTVEPGGVVTILNDETATLTLEDTSVLERDSRSVTVRFVGKLDLRVQDGFEVGFATVDGTATVADGDYLALSGTVSLGGNPGTRQIVTVTVLGDRLVEADETFSLVVNGISHPYVTIEGNPATATIRNDDAARRPGASTR